MLRLIQVCENVSVTAATPGWTLDLGDGGGDVPFGNICLEGEYNTMADYLTLPTIDVRDKLTIT